MFLFFLGKFPTDIMYTVYHSQYWAHALTLQGSGGDIGSLARSIANARVDLNPHQVDAALFALRSPLSNGVIFADEVGLGKTIEAGIILAQRWAERRRRILIIVPAMLRKQWQQELNEKFYIPSLVVDSKIFNEFLKTGSSNPFEQDKLVICSYHFASAKTKEIIQIPWDLVVIDEAHRLRNIYRSREKTNPDVKKSMAHKITDAIGQAPKLLLTATPLQNSLMELYGLISVIDDHVFGDTATFRDLFMRFNDEQQRNLELKQRIQPLCFRTLRKQVTEYVPFTQRIPITQDFTPTDAELELYNHVCDYLQRDHLIALPASQRQLITLILLKLLASSTYAISHTLRRLINRLENLQQQQNQLLDDEDIEEFDELEEEWKENGDGETQFPLVVNAELLQMELNDLRKYADLAESIRENAKGEALIQALTTAFEHAKKLGAQPKAVIFTESRRTQCYLFDLLSANGYENKLVSINSSNNDPNSKAIYEQWLINNKGTDRITGSKSVDIKAAVIEYFREHATILIATEAAAEGVNLQFCSLVVNYDLPWNPQRIEQRIGRCHRYGQKHDVVVLNFLNRRNEADQRVFQLLSEKFRLFDGVFGASDEVLGAVESGVDIERRIATVYQTCRTSTEIQNAFDTLQMELDQQIQTRLAEPRRTLLDHFDEDVRSRLRINKEKTIESLSQRERWLLNLTRTELNNQAQFDLEHPRFSYTVSDASSGWYNLDWKQAEANNEHFYRQDHPLAVRLVENAINRNLPTAELVLDYTGYGSRITILEPLIGQTGWLELSKFSVQALHNEEFLIFAARTDTGQVLDEEICSKLLMLPGREGQLHNGAPDLIDIRQANIQVKLETIKQRNNQFFDEEVLKLDRWSEDLKEGLEREIKELDKQIRESRKAAVLTQSLQDKLEAQKAIKYLEQTRNTKRRELFDAQDAIDEKREQLILKIKTQLAQQENIKHIFCIHWQLI
jgi:adenine-specific DNA-methyltransferase